MRRLLFIVLWCVIASSSWALHVETVGTACEVHNGNDTIFIFNEQPHLRSLVGKVNWWRTVGTDPIQTDADETSMAESGDRVIVEKNGKILDVVYVFNYKEHKPTIHGIDAQMDCHQTILHIDATIPPMTYTDTNALSHTLAREASVTFTNLSWADSKWVDSIVSHPFTLRSGNIILPAAYRATHFNLMWDMKWHEDMYLPIDSVGTQSYDPIAARGKLTALATIRGSKTENEVDRPIEQSNLTASGPLEVSFMSNPTPAVRFYEWYVYKGSEQITARRDESIRYTFYEPGTYKTVMIVRGDSCSQETDPENPNYADSINVTIKESELFVPNVFTPNGDTQNDEFRVIYRSIKDYHIWIYNRWGKLVYESTDPAKGWDGNIGRRPAAEGAYFWIIRATGTDAGTDPNNPNLGVYRMSGDINLLR